jgi:serine phosphatase RsbU (regulator of sigma subunit)
MKEQLLPLIAESFKTLPDFSSLKYFAILSLTSGNTNILYVHKKDDFTNVEPKLSELLKEDPKENDEISAAFKDSPINFYLVQLKDDPDYFIMAQDDEAISDKIQNMFTFFVENIHAAITASMRASNEKYKAELAKLREFQARLFPKFDDVKSLDISSVYLPADLMSGNFIDAFYVNETTYQVTICSVEGYDAASSFTSATIRTLIRTNSRKMSPSGILRFTMEKVDKVASGLRSLIFVTLLQINLSSGKCIISSLGPPNILHISGANRKLVSTNDMPTGKLLTKRKDYLDITLHLEEGDTFLFYSNGVMKATSPTTNEYYSLKNIVLAVRDNLEEGSLFLTHAISDSIYEFTEYSHYEEDIILLAAKRKAKE